MPAMGGAGVGGTSCILLAEVSPTGPCVASWKPLGTEVNVSLGQQPFKP